MAPAAARGFVLLGLQARLVGGTVADGGDHQADVHVVRRGALSGARGRQRYCPTHPRDRRHRS
jgi:hypothetical protein